MKILLICLCLISVQSSLRAQGLEEGAFRARMNFGQALGGFRLPVFKPMALPRAQAPMKAPAAASLEELFAKGAKPAQNDLRGWFAGRRFTKAGPTAALLVGADVYNDPKQGPIAGSSFKIFLWAAEAPSADQPETYWDEPGSAARDTVIGNISEQGPDWVPADFAKDKSVVTRKGEAGYEIRRSGDWFVARFPNGDYGYFFKKVR